MSDPSAGRPSTPPEKPEINWTLIERLSVRPHKHLNIVEDATYGLLVGGVFDNASNGVGEVMQEARTVQHLCDLAAIPEGSVYDAHIDARVYQLMMQRLDLAERLGRISNWHSRESGPGGLVGDSCNECGHRWPCDTRRMAEGTYVDEENDDV